LPGTDNGTRETSVAAVAVVALVAAFALVPVLFAFAVAAALGCLEKRPRKPPRLALVLVLGEEEVVVVLPVPLVGSPIWWTLCGAGGDVGAGTAAAAAADGVIVCTDTDVLVLVLMLVLTVKSCCPHE
jgi:hypothetical protein